ncbi:MAG: hypothetical protein QOK28_1884 [Actinomycetota bacterium]|jgi:hypothetical protein
MDEVNAITLFEPHMLQGDEKALLLTHLRLVQQDLLWKLEGLSDEQLRRPMTKTGTNLVGIVKHLAGVTAEYLCSSFGREREYFPWEADDSELWYGGDMWAMPHESPADIIACYRRACDAAVASIEALDLDATGKHHVGVTVSLRWMILTVLNDTLRHCGHADIVREMVDGRVGMSELLTQTVDDDEYWEKFHARMAGELSAEDWIAYNQASEG